MKTSIDKVMTCKDCMKNGLNFSYGLKTSMEGHRQNKFQARRNKTRITNTKLPQQSEQTMAKIKCVKDDNMITQHDAISHIQSECPKWIPDVQRSRDHTSMAISKQIQFVPDIESKVMNDHTDSTKSPQSSQYQTGNHIQLKKSHSSTNISLRCTATYDTIDLKSRPKFKISPKSDPKCDKKTHIEENILIDVINDGMSELDTKVRITVTPVSRHENEAERSQEDQSEPTIYESHEGRIVEACSPEVRTQVNQAEILSFQPLMHVIDKIANGERVPPQITMRYELLRFCTLRSFPKQNKPYITKIAQAGFYFANTDDEVVCYCCARRKSNWREDDVPLEIHRELNPKCSFLLRNLEVNVPVRMSELLMQDINRCTYSQILENANQTSSASTSDTISCNTNGSTSPSSITANTSAPNVTQAISSPVVSANSEVYQNRLQSRAHGNFVMTSSASSFVQEHQSNSVTTSNGIHASPVLSSSSLRPTSQLSAQGTDTPTTSKYPKYASKSARETSYNICGDIVIPPDSLATSGFFYAGFGDCVRCFQCGVGFCHWSEEDDPWIAHSRWSKDCLFVKQVRGQDFVNIVQMAVQYSQNTPGGSPIEKSQSLEQKKLKQEKEQLKQQSLCTKCKQNDVCIVFLPCGHLVTCETCAPTIRYCSVEGCGKYIKGTVGHI